MTSKKNIYLLFISLIILIINSNKLNSYAIMQYDIIGTKYKFKIMEKWKLYKTDSDKQFMMFQREPINKNEEIIISYFTMLVEPIDPSSLTGDHTMDRDYFWMDKQLQVMKAKRDDFKMRTEISEEIIQSLGWYQKYNICGSWFHEFTTTKKNHEKFTEACIYFYFLNDKYDLISFTFGCTPDTYEDLKEEIIYILKNFESNKNIEEEKNLEKNTISDEEYNLYIEYYYQSKDNSIIEKSINYLNKSYKTEEKKIELISFYTSLFEENDDIKKTFEKNLNKIKYNRDIIQTSLKSTVKDLLLDQKTSSELVRIYHNMYSATGNNRYIDGMINLLKYYKEEKDYNLFQAGGMARLTLAYFLNIFPKAKEYMLDIIKNDNVHNEYLKELIEKDYNQILVEFGEKRKRLFF